MNPEVTQQPRTPTTGAGRALLASLFDYENEPLSSEPGTWQDYIAAIEAEARAELLAQIEKAVREIARDETSGRCGAALMRVLAAIRSAAPVEPT